MPTHEALPLHVTDFIEKRLSGKNSFKFTKQYAAAVFHIFEVQLPELNFIILINLCKCIPTLTNCYFSLDWVQIILRVP